MAFPETPARKFLRGAGLGFDLDGVGRFFSDLWDLIKAKAAELAAFLPGLLSALAKKVDELFPPDTRSETLQRWLHIAVTVVLPAALGALTLLCLARCCWRCCCAGAARGRGGRATMVAHDPGFMASATAMMVAPGRGGASMPRGVFEDDPRRYFRDLRAKKPLVY